MVQKKNVSELFVTPDGLARRFVLEDHKDLEGRWWSINSERYRGCII